MENHGDLTNSRLLILAFLYQTDCGDSQLQKELDSLGRELNFTRDINCNGRWIDNTFEDGNLETDGHFPSSIRQSLGDIQPQVELNWPLNHAQAEAIREVAAGLIEIGDQLESRVVAEATQNLARKLKSSPIQQWKEHLSLEVDWVVRQGLGVSLDHLPHERVIMALTLTLVKGVCQQAPRLLRHLFNTALQYISLDMAR